ncbi:hypothetical protein BC937DRAFT_91295 [Endogone sp. FLAS-F59071]|nr:hypothetical protein BC937DRAFT_91295 [Endogone sp. FLAS-F59071]|eukprot:RUS16362.1 hypothetical protein BC937DRAFT_91295 [Endogone sp. FLAS-F59071]
MAFHSDDDAFDITSTFLDIPVERDAIKVRKEEKYGSNVAAVEALRLAKKNREKKRQEREKRRKRKRGEEVSDDEDEGEDDSDNLDGKSQNTDGADSDEDVSDESSDSDSETSSSEKDSTAELKTKKRKSPKEKERKKQKKAKKEKKEKAMAAGTTTMPDPHKRGEFGVWVGNLAFSTTSKTIQDFFKDCGKIVRIFCPTGYDKKMNQGFAYVDFATPEAQAKAIKRSEHVLDKRNLLIKDSKNFTKNGRPKRDDQETGTTAGTVNPKNSLALSAPQQHAPSPTLFVGNLSFRTTPESLQTLFEECGRIRKVRMASFEDSGKCKGFAYIDFYEPESATTALNAKNKRYMMGRKLRMEYASEEATKRGAPWLMRKEQEKGSKSKDMTELKVHSQKENAPLPRVERNLENLEGRKDASERDGRHEHDSKRRKQRDRHIQAHQKPGAVLASKTRQKVGAVKFEGTKIKFE